MNFLVAALETPSAYRYRRLEPEAESARPKHNYGTLDPLK
jgi:hypothetical protein